MKWHGATVVVGTAAATALAVLALCWMGHAIATEGQPAEIQRPVLKADGCEITLQVEPGDRPSVKLVAVNPTGAAATLEATVRLMVQPKPNPMARMVLLPRKTWEQKVEIALKPGERKTLDVPTDAAVSADSMATFQLQVGKAVVSAPAVVLGAQVPAAVQRVTR